MPPAKGKKYQTEQSQLIAEGRKRCGKCQEILPLDQFYRAKNSQRSNGYYSACKSCENQRAATRNATPEQRERNRELKYLARYGITLEDYARLLEAQDSRCAICGTPHQEGHPLRVDHCHTTMTVRGLLCHTCNTGIGYFRDNPGHAMRAAAYLERNPPP